MLPSGRRRSRVGWVRHFRDFTTLKRISAGAALILAAEYDRIAHMSGIPPATVDVEKWNPYVATILSRLGFFDLLNLEPYINEPADALIVKQMVSDNRAKGGVAIDSIKQLFAEVGGQRRIRIDLSSAAMDAVENVVNHAYPEEWPELRMTVPRWWFVGAADPVARTVVLVIYDQGITIPLSLPKKWTVQQLSSVFTQFFGLPFKPEDPKYDGQAIDAAMKVGATSTGVQHRGQGLAKMKELIGRCPAGRLRIVSRHGECVYGADGSQRIVNHPVPLLGTYVELEALLDDGA